jgi:hypothetical protein
MKDLLNFNRIPVLIMALLSSQCEMSEVCASCADPDFTVFLFDTTTGGFNQSEIDSFYIIGIARGELNKPNDTTELFIGQNPFSLNGSLFNTTTLTNDYIVEGINMEFSFEITDLVYTIKTTDDNCNCDVIENKSLRIDGNFISLQDPFQSVILFK